jgi:3,4-dihydroxyphenylacetate 2,3-dioxygenase
MTLELGMLVPHTPRMCHEEQAPEFLNEIVEGMHQVAKIIEESKPDAVVIISCHWLSSFKHFVDTTPEHKGVLTAFECPELISDVPYYYPGDTDLASQLVESGNKAGIPVIGVNDPTYVWDYGTIVPLRYLIPKEDIPVIDLAVTWAASLEETFNWGQQIGRVLRESDKRIMFISSGALSHNLVRGPESMPSLSEQALDRQFQDYLHNNDLEAAWKMLPQYAKNAGVESGGRHLAALLGVLEESKKSNYYGYGQSSGSGNVIMTFEPLHSKLDHIIHPKL